MIDGVSGRALYRWSEEDGLSLESMTPGGGIPTSPLAVLPDANFKLPPASADGTLTAFDPGPFFVFEPTFEVGGGVYVRHDGQTTPIAISRVAGADPGNDTGSILNWVTPDGRYVFFQSHARLTEDAPAFFPVNDAVYRYDTETDELVYIGLKEQLFSFGFLGASKDGQTVYLTGSFGSAAEAKTTVWHNGVTKVIANENLRSEQASMTLNGRFFAWRSLDGRAILYDRDANEKVCASCTGDGGAGSPAHFGVNGRNMGNTTVRAVTEDGTMFFDTKSALLTSDRNGSKDVYAYRNGHQTLISPGNADFDAFFVGASADGTDVYFQTDQGLVPKDADECIRRL